MKKKSASQSAFFNLRVLIGFVLCSVGVFLVLAGLSKSVTGTPAATSRETPNTLFSLATGTDNTTIDNGALRSSTAGNNTAGNNNTPPPRFGPGIAYDDARGVVVMFGGSYCSGSCIWRNDTWTWDGHRWTEQHPATSPSARSETAMVYDAAIQQVVLFGGSGDGPALNDTWTWDGTNWTLQSPPESPPARDGLGMAYDTTTQKVVIFGGCTRFCVQFLGDTWTWDGTNWTEEHPASSPPSEHQMGMTYDDARSRVVLFGGSNTSGLLDDTWTWDGTTWTQETPQTSPPGRDYISVDMAFDAARSQVVLFGGSGASGLLNDTWTWDGTTWTQQTPVDSPPPGFGIPMAYDATGQEIVLYGPPYFTDTWTWDGTTWLLQAPTAALSDTDLSFGLQLVGTASPAQEVTLTNTGPITLSISSITASGDFLQMNNCGSSLAAGESCTIRIAFNPTGKGIRTGDVMITDDAADSPQVITLAGTGTVVQLSPSTLDFGDQRVGTMSRPKTVILTNTGSTSLSIHGIAITGTDFGDFVETTTCGSSVPAHTSCEIDVRFAPSDTGTRTASMRVRHDGGGEQPVRLRGTGVSN